MLCAKFDLMPNKLGEMVRTARLAKGWSQRELARRIKKSPTYIHYVERGFNPSSKNQEFQIGDEAVDDLSKALDLNPNEARLLAGYAPVNFKPRTAKEALAVIERMLPGFEGVLWSKDMTDEDAEDMLEAFKVIARLRNPR